MVRQNQQVEEHKYEGTSEDQNHINVPYIPSPLVFEILSRVGIKTIFNCRLVCKSWADLISTPEFSKLHLSRSPTTCLITSFSQGLQKKIHMVIPENHNSLIENLTFVPDINLPRIRLVPTNSCYGLVCLIPKYCSPDSNIYVSNPVLKEFISVPIPSYVEYVEDIADCVIGFSHHTNEYKVILCSYISGCYKAEIYTLGQGLWRNIVVNTPFYIRDQLSYWGYNWNEKYNACIDGALHWITRGSSDQIISCFDFVAEQFRSVPEPSEFGPLEEGFFRKVELDVINGNLSIFDNRKSDHIDIWVMKDYGVKESWSKHIVINNPIIHNGKCYNEYKPIKVMGSGKVLLINYRRRTMMLYNPKSQVFEHEFEVLGASQTIFRPSLISAYVPSLISLKDVAKGENLTVMGSK